MSRYIGDVSAYALAVSQGYTGTEEEYAELMASYATVGQTAVAAAQTATTKASEAATSATTATNKASEATTAAQTATSKAAEASTSASTATSAKDTAVGASQTATTKAGEATTAAATATSAATTAETAATNAQAAQTAAETAQEAAEDAAESVSASAAQIATNTADITELKEDLNDVNAELEDIRVGADGTTYASAGAAVRGQISGVMEEIDNVLYTRTIDGTPNIYFYDAYPITAGSKYQITNNSEGYVTLSTRTAADESGEYVESIGTIPQGTTIIFNATLSAVAIRTSFTKAGSVTVTNISTGLPLVQSTVATLKNDIKHVNTLFNYNDVLEWEIGSIYGNGGIDFDTSVRAVRTPNTKRIYVESDGRFSITNANVDIIYAFKYDHDSGAYIERLGDGNKNTINIAGGYDYRFVSMAPADTTITPETINIYSSGIDVLANGIYEIYSFMNNNGNNYSVDSAFNKNYKTLSLVGDISLHQSFCVYNKKIYSTNGSYIAIQDLDTLTEENRVAFSCGHGNSFQLGSSNLAYISGWDDNKIYVVDLDTLTLSDTITLPTTGYTTCAVDDINKFAYIFQLDTTPSIGGFYNFIVYDYDNDQIVSTKKITFKIRAMQGIDFYNGRIVVLSGLGANTDGNKYSIFNTNGDLISEFFVGDLELIEPEGVFVDRNTFDIYLSYLVENVGYKLYKLMT